MNKPILWDIWNIWLIYILFHFRRYYILWFIKPSFNLVTVTINLYVFYVWNIQILYTETNTILAIHYIWQTFSSNHPKRYLDIFINIFYQILTNERKNKKNLVYPTNNARIHIGHHSPATIKLLGRLGTCDISISIRANSDPINGYALRRIIISGVPSPV